MQPIYCLPSCRDLNPSFLSLWWCTPPLSPPFFPLSLVVYTTSFTTLLSSLSGGVHHLFHHPSFLSLWWCTPPLSYPSRRLSLSLFGGVHHHLFHHPSFLSLVVYTTSVIKYPINLATFHPELHNAGGVHHSCIHFYYIGSTGCQLLPAAGLWHQTNLDVCK